MTTTSVRRRISAIKSTECTCELDFVSAAEFASVFYKSTLKLICHSIVGQVCCSLICVVMSFGCSVKLSVLAK